MRRNEMSTPEIIKCRFNIFQEGRKYTGHHRNYVLENAKSVCLAPETVEGIKLREKLGYLGHGRRQMAGKMAIDEVERITTPDGKTLIVENVPSNVTVHFAIDDEGNVEHHQELLTENAPGKIVSGLNKSKVGGFSWAMGGKDGGAYGITRGGTAFDGFDYVMNPGFSRNRGYILESAAAHDMILENIVAAGVDDKKAEEYLHSWQASALLANEDLLERLAQAEIYESGLVETHEVAIAEASEKLAAVTSDYDGARTTIKLLQDEAEARKAIVLESAKKSPIVVPDDVAEAMISLATEEDFAKMIGFFESAAKVDLSRYPVLGREGEKPKVDIDPVIPDPPEYGTAAAAPILDGPIYKF